MARIDWNAQAVRAVDYINNKMFEAHRGVVPWHNRLVIAFGNEGFTDDNAAHDVIAAIRGFTHDSPGIAVELGFGLDSGNGYSWAMILRVGSDCEDSEAAALALDEIMWRAWELSNGISRTGKFAGGYQRQLANRTIIKELEAPTEF
jgi:hypothetical protein